MNLLNLAQLNIKTGNRETASLAHQSASFIFSIEKKTKQDIMFDFEAIVFMVALLLASCRD